MVEGKMQQTWEEKEREELDCGKELSLRYESMDGCSGFPLSFPFLILKLGPHSLFLLRICFTFVFVLMLSVSPFLILFICEYFRFIRTY